jgi:hypothetical protein
MGLVMVKGATLQCSHGGQITISTGTTRMNVDNDAVVTSGMESDLSFAAGSPPGCNSMTTSANLEPAPCVTSAATAGQSSKLSVGGQPVLLDVATGLTRPAASPAAPGTWKVASPGQTKLESV